MAELGELWNLKANHSRICVSSVRLLNPLLTGSLALAAESLNSLVVRTVRTVIWAIKSSAEALEALVSGFVMGLASVFRSYGSVQAFDKSIRWCIQLDTWGWDGSYFKVAPQLHAEYDQGTELPCEVADVLAEPDVNNCVSQPPGRTSLSWRSSRSW